MSSIFCPYDKWVICHFMLKDYRQVPMIEKKISFRALFMLVLGPGVLAFRSSMFGFDAWHEVSSDAGWRQTIAVQSRPNFVGGDDIRVAETRALNSCLATDQGVQPGGDERVL